MQSDQAAPVAASGDKFTDSIACPLFFSRLACAIVWLLPVALGAVEIALQNGFTLRMSDGGSMLILFAALALFNAAMALLIFLGGPRLSVDPVLLAVVGFAATAAMAIPVLLGFVASITYESVIPFVVPLPPVYVWWVIVWPRGTTWERWISSKQAPLLGG